MVRLYGNATTLTNPFLPYAGDDFYRREIRSMSCQPCFLFFLFKNKTGLGFNSGNRKPDRSENKNPNLCKSQNCSDHYI